ncbi:MAG: GNAT family N-acetyltransferase [Gammaproteobacteria bacterium]
MTHIDPQRQQVALSIGVPQPWAAPAPGYSLSFLKLSDALGRKEVRAGWSMLAAESANRETLYQSPTWTESWLSAGDRRRTEVAVMRNASGSLVGAVPIRYQSVSLEFEVGNKVFHRRSWQVANILGSQPLLPDEHDAHATLYEAILRRNDACSGLLFRKLPTDSYTWHALQAYAEQGCLIHPLDGVRKQHYIHLAQAPDACLARMSRKHRRYLRERMAAFDEAANPGSRLVRIDSPQQVRVLLSLAARVSQQSWQHRELGPRVSTDPAEIQRLTHLASSGVLRSYLLFYREEPCAFAIGYQYKDVYHYVEVGYAEKFAGLSPGTVLLLMIQRDLAGHRPARWLDFGWGEAPYKARFGTHSTDNASVIVLPRTYSNRALTSAHAGFVRIRDRVRDLVRARTRR